ncbi:MAG: hypothetical protein IJ228_08700 [Succinivibrio sp.]|nr:hypothetical protein [Succinivibrio sp.]
MNYRNLSSLLTACQQKYQALRARFDRASFAQLSALCVVPALLCEVFIFNLSYFTFDAATYQEYPVALPQAQAPDAGGLPLGPQNSVLTLNNINLPARTVLVELRAPHSFILNATVAFTDDTSAQRFNAAGQISVNPGGSENSALAVINPHGKLHSLQIIFDPARLNGGVRLTRLTVNAPVPFEFSFLRLILLTAGFILISALCRPTLRRALTPDYTCAAVAGDTGASKTKAAGLGFLARLPRYAVLAAALGLVLFTFDFVNPRHTQPAGYQTTGEVYLPYTNPEHTLLRPLPQTLDELNHSDPYAALLSAFLHGHLYLNYPVDPGLERLQNPYDPSQRAAAGLKTYLDLAYYRGHYYLYFGLAPLILAYAPVYALTGKVPSLALAGLILALLAVLALYAALRVLFYSTVGRSYAFAAHGAALAVFCVCGICLLQTSVWHYILPYLSSITFLSLCVACAFALLLPRYQEKQPRRICLMLLGVGISFVVMSRPLALLFALTICLPPLYAFAVQRLRETQEQVLSHSAAPVKSPLQALLPDLLCLAIPLGAGALFVMWYNYARFGSIFEFGQFLQLTGSDISANSLRPTLKDLRQSLWYFIAEPLEYVKNFPYVLPQTHPYADHGSYVFLAPRLGLLAVPLTWALALILLPLKSLTVGTAKKDNETVNADSARYACPLPPGARVLRISAWLTLFALPVVAFLEYKNAGVAWTYNLDLIFPALLVSFALLLSLCRPELKSPLIPVFYCLVGYVILKTILTGLMLIFSIDANHILELLSPDRYLYFTHTLTLPVF